MNLKSTILAGFLSLIPSAANAQVPSWITTLSQDSSLNDVSTDKKEVTCLALVIYFEARGESQVGQQAVGNVVVNRIRSGRYPKTVCEVLFQRGQFSFIRNGVPSLPKTAKMWKNAVAMAQAVLGNNFDDASRGAMRFCQRRLRKSGHVIGNHVFY